jgi:hypothetical protein
MHEDSPNTRTAMVLIFMGLVVALAAVLFVMIAYGYGEKSGPGGFPSAQVEGQDVTGRSGPGIKFCSRAV